MIGGEHDELAELRKATRAGSCSAGELEPRRVAALEIPGCERPPTIHEIFCPSGAKIRGADPRQQLVPAQATVGRLMAKPAGIMRNAELTW
jgi:hypothetical protein